MDSNKKTPLYDFHLNHGGKIVPFAGFLLPVQYSTGVITEHMATRTKAGLFDVSHMGEVIVSGNNAVECVNHLLTNDVSTMKINQVKYSLMCYPDGGVIDDLLVYRLGENKFMMVINASNIEKDVEWIKNNLVGDVTFCDVSDDYAQIALQGPESEKIILKLANETEIPKKYYTISQSINIAGVKCQISRTGYTGEYGYEILCDSYAAMMLWNRLLEAGCEYGAIPCGLGARDTLRLEAGMPLYGHELSEEISPLEAGLDFAVKLEKNEFIGKHALLSTPPARKRIGLKVTGRGIVREHSDVYEDGSIIGKTTSGTYCPYIGYPAAMALVKNGSADIGDIVLVDVRGKMVEAEVVDYIFIKDHRRQL